MIAFATLFVRLPINFAILWFIISFVRTGIRLSDEDNKIIQRKIIQQHANQNCMANIHSYMCCCLNFQNKTAIDTDYDSETIPLH